MEVCNNFHLPARVVLHQKRGKEYHRCCFSQDEKLQKSIDYLTNYIPYYSDFFFLSFVFNKQHSFFCGVEYDDTPEDKTKG